MMRINPPIISLTRLAGCIAIVLSSGYSFNVLAVPLTGIIISDQSGTSFTTNSLRVTTGGIAGATGEQNEVTSGGSLSIDGGGTVLGGLDLIGANLTAGLSGSGQINLGTNDVFTLKNGSTANLVNVKVIGPGQGIISSSGELTTSQNTVIDMRGARAADVQLTDGIALDAGGAVGSSSVAHINGSTIFADESGVALDDCGGSHGTCEVIATDAHIEGGRVGVLQAGGTSTVHGGSIIGTGSDTADLQGTGSGYLLYG